VIATTLGGVGLFLLGMILMTDGLKAVAGDALRKVLGRFVSGPLSALFSGATVTALVQSSSATTLTTIGFVSAGLLTFPQAVGVIFGSNLGTTSTGWLVSLLGLKVNVGAVALPLVGVGALMRLLTRERMAALGLALAGFGLIFVGIDTLQQGMKELATRFDLSALPADSVGGRLLLVALGAAMTVVMQSSSAAVATTLTALHTGTIGLSQAAALVIGQNIGTTITAAVAGIGASVPARRTALAHILFNVLTGVVAFLIMPAFLRVVVAASEHMEGEPGATSLALFHTAFNVLGVVLLLPFVQRFSDLVMKLVPERGPALTRNLDRTVASVPEVAVEAARRTAVDIAVVVVEGAQGLLSGSASKEEVLEGLETAEQALGETRNFLSEVGTAEESAEAHRRHVGVLHACDHLGLLIAACREVAGVRKTVESEEIGPIVNELRELLARARGWLGEAGTVAPVEQLGERAQAVQELRREKRSTLLARTAEGGIQPGEVDRLLEVLRWVEGLSHHAWRAVFHLQERPGARAAPGAGPRAEAEAVAEPGPERRAG
jgi:phosphate:Na+ symporter